MSGIYIHGMEMPKDIEPGLVIEFADGIDGKRYARLYHYRHGGLTEWLEAVPVPPHGDLIDRDAIRRYAEMMITSEHISPNIEHFVSVKYIDEAPTVIPADGEEGG